MLIIILCIFFLAFSVFFHELGHLLAALYRGLYVDKFAVGFGPKLFAFKYKGIEFSFRLLPLGGFVSIPQMNISDKMPIVDNKELPLANAKDKIIVALAGPIFNIILAFTLACILWVTGQERIKPSNKIKVDAITSETPAYKAGLRKNDKIIKINNESFNSLEEFSQKIILDSQNIVLTLERDNKIIKTSEFTLEKNIHFRDIPYPQFKFSPLVGESQAIIESVIDDYPAHKAGLRKNDKIIKIDNKPIASIYDLSSYVHSSNAQDYMIEIERNGKIITKNISLKIIKSSYLGLIFKEDSLKIARLDPTRELEKKYDLRIGDEIIKANNQWVGNPQELENVKSKQEKGNIILTIQRRANVFDKKVDIEFAERKIFGIYWNRLYENVHINPFTQIKNIINSTILSLKSLFSPSSPIGIKHLSSIYGIGEILYTKIKKSGLIAGISLIMLINVSLAILNLLPIPILDGGHILISIIESIIKRPIPAKVLNPIMTVFFFLFIFLSIYTIKNDIFWSNYKLIAI